MRDRLYKDITYSHAAGDGFSEKAPLTLGARFRDSGFKNGLIGDLQVFDTALTAAEVAGTLRRDPSDDDALAHFVVASLRADGRGDRGARDIARGGERLLARIPEIMVMEELPEPRPAHLLKRGAYDAPGDIVPRETPASLPPFPHDQPRNRLGLARWLTDRRNPLAARVVVNRDLAPAFRARPGRNAGGFRQPGPAADASRTCSTGSPHGSWTAGGT